MIIRFEDVEKYVYGGSILGSGGGGSIKDGVENGKLATQISPIKLMDIEEMDEDNIAVTISVVGVQSKGRVLPYHHIRTIQLMENFDVKIDGFISSECGPMAITHGWIQASIYNKPIIDCPCDGRAHPTAVMGAIGLHKIKDYTSIQSAAGGDKNLEIVVKGDIETTSKIIRQFSVEAGGSVAVARNPVKISYLAKNGAKRAIKQAYEIGEVLINTKKPYEKIEAVMGMLNGEIICVGEVKAKRLISKGGFDVGFIDITDEKKDVYRITFVNEYMSIHVWDKIKVMFPNLINIFNIETGMPLNSVEVKIEDKVALTYVDAGRIKLGSGVMDPEVYKQLEKMLLDEISMEISFKK
ncbi:MAG: DUF917 family protein [Candidatus Methanomethylicia archaeon]